MDYLWNYLNDHQNYLNHLNDHPNYPNHIKKIKNKEKNHLYDFVNDIIQLQYILNGKLHKICIERTENIPEKKQIFDEIMTKKTMVQYPILDAVLTLKQYDITNKKTSMDITERLNMYLGPQRCHSLISKLKIRWILSENEIKDFISLSVLSENTDEDMDMKYVIYENMDSFIE